MTTWRRGTITRDTAIAAITSGRWPLCAGAGLRMCARHVRRATGGSTCCCAAFIAGLSLRASRFVMKWAHLTMEMASYAHPMNYSLFARTVESLDGVLPRTHDKRRYARRLRAVLPCCVSCHLVFSFWL